MAVGISIVAIFVAGKANSLNKRIFKRSGVISLYEAWKGTNTIDTDPTNIVGPDVVKAANSLSLTAALWNHDIVEKIIIFQSFWTSYRTLYDTLNSSNSTVPGLNIPLNSLITSEMRAAYNEMAAMERGGVKTTDI